MSTSSTAPSPHPFHDTPPLTNAQRMWVFWDWCLRREALRLMPQLILVAPLVVVALCCLFFWPRHWHPGQGQLFLRILFAIASMAILGSGAIHAAQAISWEVSAELRELVRLTGIGPLTLMFCKTLARWWTIICSILLLTPAVFFAITLGGVTTDQIVACAWGLLLITVLTASMAALAGVTTADTPNGATPATMAMATFLLILLYHLVFWFSAAVITIITWSMTGDVRIPSGFWRILYDFAWQSAPITLLTRASVASSLFSPWDLSYWMHLVIALLVFRFVSVVMVYRFQTIRTPRESEAESKATSSAPRGRPRCTEAPLFWKDAHILAGGTRAQRRWTIVYVLLAIYIFASDMQQWTWDLPLTLGIMAECIWPIIFAVRLDSLIAAEFRQQTWTSLMTLPVDRRTLLWAKLKAVAWEHRGALAPLLIAIGLPFPRSPAPLFMVGVIALLAGCLMCQVSAIYYLTPRNWWNGPTQAFVALSLIIFCIALWATFPPWASFVMTVTLMFVTLLPVHYFIESHLQNWSES